MSDLIRFARQRLSVYGETELPSFYALAMSAQDRKDFDQMLVDLKHPLASEAGSGEFRFKSYLRELGPEEPARKNAAPREATTIAETIIQQLGTTIAKVHGRYLVSLNKDARSRGGLQFSARPARPGGRQANKVVIRLTFDDLYEVEFWHIPRSAASPPVRLEVFAFVFWDSLRELVEQKLGYRANPKGRLAKSATGQAGVCSWCQSLYDADGNVVRKMSAEEFDEFSKSGSHGICRKCGDELREQAAQAKRGRNGGNPRGDDRDAALRLAEKFHDQTPRAHARLKVNWPRKAVVYIGPCARIDYVSSKWDGKRARYFHEFKDCEIFAAPNPQPGGGSLLILSGKFKIKPEGLVG